MHGDCITTWNSNLPIPGGWTGGGGAGAMGPGGGGGGGPPLIIIVGGGPATTSNTMRLEISQSQIFIAGLKVTFL